MCIKDVLIESSISHNDVHNVLGPSVRRFYVNVGLRLIRDVHEREDYSPCDDGALFGVVD